MQEAVDNDDWVAVSTIAERRGVTRQAISKRVGKLGARLPTRGVGRSLRVHLPTFEELAGESHDPAQDLRNRVQKRAAPVDDDAPRPSVAPAAPREPSEYDSASAQKKRADAELAQMKLSQARGELVPVREIANAAVTCGTEIGQIVTGLKANAGKLYAASRGGEEALAICLTELTNAALGKVADSLAKLAARGAAESD
jgi:hypothetical protein